MMIIKVLNHCDFAKKGRKTKVFKSIFNGPNGKSDIVWLFVFMEIVHALSQDYLLFQIYHSF